MGRRKDPKKGAKLAEAPGAGPIARKLLKRIASAKREKVVDMRLLSAAEKEAEELAKGLPTPEDLAKLHPAHAAYAIAHNHVATFSEFLSHLPELRPFVKMIAEAKDRYLPAGPPWSPLTASFFDSWSFFDASVGDSEETIGAIVLVVCEAVGTEPTLLSLIAALQRSRMGVYVCERGRGTKVRLRELVTGATCEAVVPSGHKGRKGELWYARVLPPPLPLRPEHVVMTTPYILVEPGRAEWEAYFDRHLPEGPPEERVQAYERHMKYGPRRDYWSEFVLNAYQDSTESAIALVGLPDAPDTWPPSLLGL
ncbi:MAG: hypothetical protein ACUVYA_04190 [Planctomycetota bacterium]